MLIQMERVLGKVVFSPVDIDSGEFELSVKQSKSTDIDNIKDTLVYDTTAFVSTPAYCRVESSEIGTMHIRCETEKDKEESRIDILSIPGRDGTYLQISTYSKMKGIQIHSEGMRHHYSTNRKR